MVFALLSLLLRYISEDVRLCRISCYMYMRSEQNRQRPKKGVADVRGYNGAGRKFSSFQHFQDKILAVTWDNIIIGSEKKTFVFANMQTDDCGSIGS